MKIKDFNKMITSYDELLKAFVKAQPVIKKEQEKELLAEKEALAKGLPVKKSSWLVGNTPRFYVRILTEMEKIINETWEDSAGRKAMSKVCTASTLSPTFDYSPTFSR